MMTSSAPETQNCSTEGWLWLTLGPGQWHIQNEKCFFQVYIPRKWLVDRLVSNSPDSRVANVVIDKTDLKFWHRYITLFAKRFWLNLPWFVLRDRVPADILEASVACVIHLDTDPCLETVTHVRGKIVSGGVSVMSRNGFDDANNPFWDSPDSGSPSSAAIQLCRRLWPGGGTDEATAAFIFGASSFQMEILDRLDQTDKNRRRLQLYSSKNGVRIWETVPCPQAQAVLSPTEVVTKRLEDLSEALNEKDSQTNEPLMRVQLDQRRREGSIEPTVFYRIEFAAQPPAPKKMELIRPVVRLLFPGHSGSVSWSPGSLKVSRDPENHTIYEFSDEQADELLKKMALGSGGDAPNWEVQLDWKHDAPGARPILEIFTVPALYAKGRTPIQRESTGLPAESPDSEYVWHLAALEPGPAPSQPLPRVWVRYHIPDQIPDQGKSGPPERRLEGLSGAILLPHDLDPNGWSLGFDVPAKDVPAKDDSGKREDPSPSILGMFTVDSAKQTVLAIKLRILRCHVTAYAPRMTVYKDRLVDPASVPNAKKLDETLGQAALVFSNDKPTTAESAPAQGITAMFESAFGGFKLQGSEGAAVAYVPYHRPGSGAPYQAALIDLVSPSRGNLVQQPDPISGRTLIPRDVNHGLVPWTIKSWRFHPLEGEPVTVGLAFDDNETEPKVDRESKDAVMALAPWVQWVDRAYKPDTAVRILHHRNLVLEHGEFETSAEDRKVGGRPSALPANTEDFVQAVRDPYTVAADKLKETPPAVGTTDDAQLVNWLPGAYVVDTAGQAWPGKVWLQLPLGGEGKQRLPAVRCSKIEEEAQDPSLSILWCESNQAGEPQGTKDWLTYDVKWKQVIPQAPRPTLVLKRAAELPPGDGFRLRNSSAPLLFDGAAVTAVCGPSQDMGNLATAGGRDGLVRVWDVPTGRMLARYRCYPDGGLVGDAPVVLAVSLSSLNSELYLAAVTEKGSLRVWNYTQNSAPTEHSPTTAVKSAAIQQLGTTLHLVIADPNAEVHVFRWDPASPATLTEIPFPAGRPKGERVTAMSAGNVLYVAACGRAIPVTVYKVSDAGVSEIVINNSPQQALACSLLNFEKQWLAVAGTNRSLEVFSMDGDEFLPWDKPTDGSEKFTPVEWGDLAGVCLGELPAESCFPVKLFASWSDGAIRRWQVPENKSTELKPGLPELAYTGHYGAVQAMACCAMAIRPYSNHWRPQLLSAGMDGTARIWDMAAAYERGRYLHDERVYDNLGTIRSTRWNETQSDWIIEEVTYPNCIDIPRSAISYRPPGSVIAVSYPATKTGSSPEAIVEEKDGNQVITQIYFACEGLKLVKQTYGTWIPERFADDSFKEYLPSGEFPFHRGHQGVYGFSSTTVGVHSFTLGWPLLGGVPLYPVRLDSMRFDDKRNPTEIVFLAAVVNPVDVIGEEKEDEIPGLVREAVSRGALIQVTLSKKEAGFSVTKAEGTIDWHFPLGLQEQSAFPFTGFSGKLARLTAKVSYETVPNFIGMRLVLTLGEGSGSAVALGVQWPLALTKEPPMRLVGSNSEGHFGFAPETKPSKPVTASNPACVFQGHTGPVTGVAVGDSADDYVMVTSSQDGTARLWDAATGFERTRFAHVITTVRSVSLKEENYVFCGGSDRIARIWGTKGTLEHRFVGHTGVIHALEFVPSTAGPRLVTVSGDRTVRIWDVNSEMEIHRISLNTEPVCVAAKKFSTGHALVVGCADTKARLWTGDDLWKSGSTLSDPKKFDHRGRISAMALDDVFGSSCLATAGIDGKVVLWDIDANTRLSEQSLHHGAVTAVSFGELSGAHYLITASLDGTARLSNLTKNGNMVITPDEPLNHDSPVTGATMMQVDAKWLLFTALKTGRVCRWDDPQKTKKKTDRPQVIVQGKSEEFVSFSAHSANNTVVMALGTNQSKTVVELPFASGAKRVELGHAMSAAGFGRMDTPHVLICAGNNAEVRDPETQRLIWSVSQPARVTDAAIAAYKSEIRLAVGGEDGLVRIWDPESQKRVGQFAAHAGAVSSLGMACLEVDGKPQWYVGTVGADKELRVWDGESGLPRNEFRLASAGDDVHFSHVALRVQDGTMKIAVGGSKASKGLALLWTGTVKENENHVEFGDAKTYEHLDNVESVQSVAFATHNGKQALLTGCRNKDKPHTAYLWDEATANKLAELSPHQGAVTSVAWTEQPAGNTLLATGAEDGTATLWYWKTGQLTKEVLSTTDNPGVKRVSVAFVTRDGVPFALVARSGNPAGGIHAEQRLHRVELWDLTTKKEVALFEVPIPRNVTSRGVVSITSAMITAPHALTGDAEGMAWIWDARNGAERRSVAVTGSSPSKLIPVTCVQWVPSGSGAFAAVGSEDKMARLWDAADGRLKQKLEHNDVVRSISAIPPDMTGSGGGSPNEPDFVLIGGDGDQARLWYNKGKDSLELPSSGSMPNSAVALQKAATGSLEALSGGTGKVFKLWPIDVSSGTPQAGTAVDFEALDDAITSVAFARVDGQPHVQCATVKDKIELWYVPQSDREDPGRRWIFAGNSQSRVSSAFLSTPDGPQVFSGGPDGSARRWEVENYLRISSQPKGSLLYHLPVELMAEASDSPVKLEGRISPGKHLNLFVRTPSSLDTAGAGAAAPPLLRHAATPAIRQGPYYGFLLGTRGEDRKQGIGCVALWIEGALDAAGGASLAGIVLREEISVDAPCTVKLCAAAPGGITAKGPRIRLQALFFDLSTNRFETYRVTSWSLSAVNQTAMGDPVLKLQVGDFLERPRGHAVTAGTWYPSVAHLEFHIGTDWFQGPVGIGVDESGDGFCLKTGAYWAEPVATRSSGATVSDVSFPMNGTATSDFDIIVADQDTKVADQHTKRQGKYIRLENSNQAIKVSSLDSSAVPVNPCLDPDTIRAIETLPARVPQLVHREVQGARLRYRFEEGYDIFTPEEKGSTWSEASNDKKKWVLFPVVSGKTGARILRQMLWLESSTVKLRADQQTENLLVLQRPLPGEQGSDLFFGIINTTAGVAPDNGDAIVSKDRVDEQLTKLGKAGLTVHRVLRSGGPPTYRFRESPFYAQDTVAQEAPSAEELGEAMAAPKALADIETVQVSVGEALDFRLLPPERARHWVISRAGRHLPVRPGPDVSVDTDPVAFRRLKLFHHAASPPATKEPVAFRYQVLESTAFRRMQPVWFLPSGGKNRRGLTAQETLDLIANSGMKLSKKEANYLATAFIEENRCGNCRFFLPGSESAKGSCAVVKNDNNEAATNYIKEAGSSDFFVFQEKTDHHTFQPRSMELRLAPDKPGAMFHHKMHALAEPTGPETQVRPELLMEPITDVAIREPQQFAPPLGARIDLKKSKYESGKALWTEEFSFEWEETIGAVPVHKDLAETISIRQKASGSKELVVNNAMQIIVQINEDLLDIDASTPHIPIYVTKGGTEDVQDLPAHGTVFFDSHQALESICWLETPYESQILTVGGGDVKLWRLELAEQANVVPSFTLKGKKLKTATSAHYNGEGQILAATDTGEVALIHPTDLDGQNAIDLTSSANLTTAKSVAAAVVRRAAQEKEPEKVFECWIVSGVSKTSGSSVVLVWIHEQGGTVLGSPILLPTGFEVHRVSAAGRLPSFKAGGQTRPLDQTLVFLAHGERDGQGQLKVWEQSVPAVTGVAPVVVSELKDVKPSSAHLGQSQDRFLVITGEDSGNVTVWQLPESGAQPGATAIHTFSAPSGIASIKLVQGEAKTFVAACSTTGFVGLWSLESGKLIRSLKSGGSPWVDMAAGFTAGSPHLLAGNSAGEVTLWDLKLALLRPPKVFLVSRDETFRKPQEVTLQELPQCANKVQLEPHLVLERESKPNAPISLKFSDVFWKTSSLTMGGRIYHVAEYDPKDGIVVNWQGVTRTWISWSYQCPQSGGNKELDLEAMLFNELGQKMIKQVPYSAVAPKMAAVLVLDRKDGGTLREILQRTILFGDAASAASGRATIVEQDMVKPDGTTEKVYMFKFLRKDTEEVTVEMPLGIASDQLIRQFFLVKYLIDGQTIATGGLVNEAVKAV